MITGTSVNFTKAVQGAELVAAVRVQMPVPRFGSYTGQYDDVTLSVSAVEVDASTTSDMPQDTRLQVGYPAMGATFTLAGLVDQSDESKTAAWLYNPYSKTSPLYQHGVLYSPVTVDFGLYTDAAAGTAGQGGVEWVRKFTGYVDSVSVSDNGDVSFACVESMQQSLRGTAQFPLIAAPVTAEYLIDYMLRAESAGAISSWPKQLTDCRLAVGFRAATVPEVGTLYTDYSPTYAPGVLGSGISGGALAGAPHLVAGGPSVTPFVAAEYYLAAPYALGGASYGTFPGTPTSANLFCEFWVDGDVSTVFPQVLFGRAPGALGASWSSDWIRITVKSTGLVVDSSLFATQTWSTTVTAGPHYVAVALTSIAPGTSLDISMQLDFATTTITRLTTNIGTTARNYVAVGWSAATGVASTIEALQVSADTSRFPVGGSGIWSFPFTPRAVLDQSLNNMQVLNEVSGGTYSVIQQLVDAELGVAGGDEAGVFRFYNRDTIRGVTSVRDVTSTTSLAALGAIQTAAASIVNHATVDWAGWQQATALTAVYSATEAIKVGRFQTVVLTPTLASPATVYNRLFTVPTDGSTGSNGSFFRASTSQAGTAECLTVNVSMRQLASNRLEITIKNVGPNDAWLVSPANYLDLPVGTPLLRVDGYAWSQITGTADVQYPPADYGAGAGAASSSFGDQPHAISGNPWIQDVTSATSLATDIVVDQYGPRPDLTGVEIVPDPRLQLIDVIHLLDPDWTGIDEYARIFGWKITWDASGTYSMTLDARTLTAPGGWIMGLAGRSEVGSTAYVY